MKKAIYFSGLPIIVGIFLLPAILFASADTDKEFLAKIEPQNVQTLKSRGYKVEKVDLKSSPDLYEVKKEDVGLFATLVEPFYIKEKRDRKKYTVTTNDTYYSSQWNIPKVKADEAWNAGASGSNTITVAVLDTGMGVGIAASSPVHEEFVGRIWTNDDPESGGDNDANGYIDDTYGWDFVSNDRNPAPDDGGSIDGDYKHGTLVAGVIAATAGNSVGVAGIDHNAKIMPIRVMDNNGDGWTTDIALAIEYAADNGAEVINMSLGYAHSFGPDTTLEEAVNYAYGKGVVLVAAAGNDNQGVNYPAALPNVIAVGATDQSDVKASFSSYGPELDIAAPGEMIYTTSTSWNGSAYTSNQYTATASGTSFSSPHVAALASLLFARDDTLTNSQVESKITAYADKVAGMGGQNRTDEYGYGRINILNSFNATPSPTSLSPPPSNPTVSAVYRFYNISNGTHFYTASAPERDRVGQLWGHIYRYEGAVYNLTNNGQNVIQLYRFWNTNGTHFYTASPVERDNIVRRWSNTYKYEGVAYYVVAAGSPVYRFYNISNGTHFYTASAEERDRVGRLWGNIYRYEGTAYHVQ